MTLLRYCVLRIATAHCYSHLGHRGAVGDHDQTDKVDNNLIFFQLSTFFGIKIQINFYFQNLQQGTALFYPSNIFRMIKSRRIRWAGRVARMGERRGVYRTLFGKPERKKTLEKHRRRWEYNIKMNLKKTGCDGVDMINLTQHSSPDGIVTLLWSWCLRCQRILKVTQAISQLLVLSPVPDKSKVMTQTKRDTLVLHVGGWGSA